MKRFIIECANYNIAEIMNDPVMTDATKAELVRKIDKYVNACKCGLITYRECMIKINGGELGPHYR